MSAPVSRAGGDTPCPSSHPNVSSFFRKRLPRNWSLREYLRIRYESLWSPRKISNGWTEGLNKIAACKGVCCNDQHRARARELLSRFNEEGSSDRAIIRDWLRAKQKSEKRKTSLAPQTIHIGPVFQGEVGTAVANTYDNNVVADGTSTTRKSAAAANSDTEDAQDSEDDFLDSEEGPPEYDAATIDSPPSPTPNLSTDRDVPPAVNSKTSALVKHARALAALTATYDSQSPQHRWHLASSRTVESVMYEACLHMDASTFIVSLAPSFILDVSDATSMRAWFTEAEWDEILRAVPPLPPADLTMVESLVRFFPAQTVSDLRTILSTTSFLFPDTPYSREKHYNANWADLVVRQILDLWESPQDPLRAPHLEDWYTSYLWSPILDRCLLSLPSLTIERKEASCRATALRRNRRRSDSRTRARTGPKLDAIIRTVEDNTHEFGGVEVARSDGGCSSSKNLGDTLKLCRALRDMLHRLHERVDHDNAVTRKIQVVGMVCAGVKMQTLRMGCWKGGVTVLVRERPMEVPVEVEVQKLCRLVAGVQRVKGVIKECVEVVARAGMRSGGEEEWVRELMFGPAEKEEGEEKGAKGRRLKMAPDTP